MLANSVETHDKARTELTADGAEMADARMVNMHASGTGWLNIEAAPTHMGL